MVNGAKQAFSLPHGGCCNEQTPSPSRLPWRFGGDGTRCTRRRTAIAPFIGCGHMGASSDNEGTSPHVAARLSHTAGYVACPSTELVNDTELRRSTATGTTARCWNASDLIS